MKRRLILTTLCAALWTGLLPAAAAAPVEGAHSTSREPREAKGSSKEFPAREAKSKEAPSREAKAREAPAREVKSKEAPSREVKTSPREVPSRDAKNSPREASSRSEPKVTTKDLSPKMDLNKTEFQRATENAKPERERQEREKARSDMRDKTHDGVLRTADKDKTKSIGIEGLGTKSDPSDKGAKPAEQGGQVTIKINTDKPEKKK